jgi:hypothetical protein
MTMMRRTILAALATVTMLVAGVPAALVDAAAKAAQTPPPARSADGPCGLLTNAEVQRAFPGAKPGQLDRKLEAQGILRCVWNHTSGTVGIIEGTGELDPIEVEAGTWALGFVDPLNRGAEKHVRYERLAGVGDQAIAVVEQRDAAKGFLSDSAYLVVRRGNRQVTLMAMDLARRERVAALAVLKELGTAIAGRLK